MPRFTCHDFRRTIATWLGSVGVAPHIVQTVLGHSLNALMRSGVADVYNRSDYLEEKRRALDAWSEHLTQLASGKVASVVALHR
jgi:integrase